MPKIKKVNSLRDEQILSQTEFPMFCLRKIMNIDDMIKKYQLEKVKYVFVTKKYLFIVNFDYWENF